MRILIVPAIDWFTALENRVHHLARCWRPNHEIHVAHLPLGGDSLRENEGNVIHRLPTARTKSLLLYYLTNFLPQIFQILRMIRKESIEIVITTNLSAGTAAIMAARISRIVAIFDYCDYLPAFSRYAGASSILQPLLGWVGKLLTIFNLTASNATVVIGERLRRHAQLHSKSVLIVPNGVEPSVFGSTSRWVPNPRPVLGYVGVLEFFVDLPSAVLALASMEGSRLIIVGDGRERPYLSSYARKTGMEGRVEFVGRVPYAQIPGWIESMDICILPFESSDLTESALPLKIHEYAACRRPIISSPLFEVVRMYGDLLAYARGPEEIAMRACQITADWKTTYRRIRRSYVRATVTYRWERFGARYEKAFLRTRETIMNRDKGGKAR